MKKKVLFTFMMVFVVSLGTAYAADYGGKSFDNFEIETIGTVSSVEKTSGESVPAGDKDLYNVNSGKSYDMFEIETAAAVKSVEGESAGGLRVKQNANKGSREGVGTSRSYDLPPMNPGLGW